MRLLNLWNFGSKRHRMLNQIWLESRHDDALGSVAGNGIVDHNWPIFLSCLNPFSIFLQLQDVAEVLVGVHSL